MKERAAPKKLAEPVTVGGVRYEPVHSGTARGLDQTTGYLSAVDPATGRELWVLKVYDVPKDPDMEDDKQDKFMTELTASADGTHLLVAAEGGRRFAVRLADRSVRPA